MNQNEITVKINCTLDELHNILLDKGFSISKSFNMKDTYFIPTSLHTENLSSREILKSAILIRDLTWPSENKTLALLTHKQKEFDEFGNITFQKSTNCKVFDVVETENFIKCLNYKILMKLEETTNVYKKGNLELAVKDIKDGDNLIEVEATNEEEMNSVEKLINSINKLNIPIDTSNYFVKKAELALDKQLRK